jgi:hypothetical protein
VTAVFLFGCFLASERHELDLRHVVIAATVALVAFRFHAGWSQFVIFFCIGLAAVTLAFGRVPYLRWADKLPDLTYGVFLVHWPIMQIMLHARPMNAEALLAASLAASVCVAYPLHVLVEEPARRLRSPIMAWWLRIQRDRPRLVWKSLAVLCLLTTVCFSAITVLRWRANAISVDAAARIAPTLLPITRDRASLAGNLEALRFDRNTRLTASGWALDNADPRHPVFVAVALDGKVAAVAQTTLPRPDVSRDHKLDSSAAPSGFSLATDACAADVVVFAFTGDGRARLLPSPDHVECPRAAGQDG